MSGSSSIIDSLIVELKLDASDFISSKDRAKEATAAIAAGVEGIDKAGDKAAKAQSPSVRRKPPPASSRKSARLPSAPKEQQRVHEQALKENDRRDKAAVKEKDKARADDVRKEKNPSASAHWRTARPPRSARKASTLPRRLRWGLARRLLARWLWKPSRPRLTALPIWVARRTT